MVETSNNSTKGLIIVSKLYQEGKIDDDQREQLKGKWIPVDHLALTRSLSPFLRDDFLRRRDIDVAARPRLRRRGGH
jgi:hypothetical protein